MTQEIKTVIGKAILARADQDSLPEDHELRDLVVKFEAAAEAAYSTNPPENAAKKMLGTWARLKLRWRDYSGEPLT